MKRPRLYTPENLIKDTSLALSDAQAHYVRAVMRMNEGDILRFFNGRDGEWAARLTNISKKSAVAAPFELIKEQRPDLAPVHLLFAPIKKNRLDFLIEKSVELGVTDLHPVLTARTEARHLNDERLQAQIIEAAEQCERMDLPQLHPMMPLLQKLQTHDCPAPVFWGRERGAAIPLKHADLESAAFLIGPEGGFDDREIDVLEKHDKISAISLGPQILRAETAALAALSYAMVARG